jgi:IPT/TIG domain-containing protein
MGWNARTLPTRLPTLIAVISVALAPLLGPSAAIASPTPRVSSPAPAVAAPTNTVHLRVEAARTNSNFYDPVGTVLIHEPVTEYKWLLNRDDAGDATQPIEDCFPDGVTGIDGVVGTNPDYPAGCDWPSIHSVRGGSAAVDQVVTQGDQDDLSEAIGLALPDGKYLISVLADGYKLDGAKFTVPMESPALVTVGVQPNPLPLATLRIKVFNDNNGTNGEWDEASEDGLAGFRGHISDVLDEVTTDWFGNPLCTQYEDSNNDGHPELDGDGRPTAIPGTGGACVSDANGDIVIPNLGPNRYAVTVIPPNGQTWIATTTLEGGHDWDTWPQEGSSGFDTEIVVGGELVPEVPFGFVTPTALPTPSDPSTVGELKGTAVGLSAYVPPAGGLIFGGEGGNRLDPPIDRPWVSLTNLGQGDTAIYVGRGLANGTFDIQNVPPGNYEMAVWDQNQDFLVETGQLTIRAGEVTDLGVYYLAHWFAIVEGTVFVDTNANGKRDPGEQGLAQQELTLRSRDNSLQDQGTAVAITNGQGNYLFREAYPLGQWVVLESYNDRYYTTGITMQTDNQPDETTILGAGVDISTFNLVGLTTRIDWGVLPYSPGTNGGIVGTVFYDATRNELDARLAAVEDYEAGISGLNVDLYAPVECTDPSTQTCDADELYQLDADGSYMLGSLLNQYVTEQWARPTDCVARNVNGDPMTFPWTPGAGGDCLEGFAMGNQVDLHEFALVNGNYGFGDGCFGPDGFDPVAQACADDSDPTALPVGYYLVKVEVPDDGFDWDPIAAGVQSRPLYNIRREEDVNVFAGDQFSPIIPPPPCAGAMHTVDVAGILPDGPDATENPTFADTGGSPYEGLEMPLCDVKLVPVNDRQSIAPTFNLFTDVPLPGRFYGLVTDDLNLSTEPAELFYGEKAGIPNIPVGLYDFSGRLIETIQTDPNGVYEVLLPSTSTYNCPLPAGPCPNVYRFVANDPGRPGHLNQLYNPQYRVLATNFQLWPNLTLPSDLAPWTIGVAVEGPGTQGSHPVACNLAADTPQLFAVNKPYVTNSGSVTITGLGFGATKGTGTVKLDTTTLATTSWSDTQIVATVPSTISKGPHQLHVTNSTGRRTVNGLTFHVLGTGYTPTVREVGPGKPYATIQAALNASVGNSRALVVVYPGTPGAFNPQGAYYENLIINSPVKLQGVGPGGSYSDGSVVRGSVIDGIGFNTINLPNGTTYADNWRTLLASLTWDGNQQVFEAAVISVFARASGSRAFTSGYRAAVDGFTIQGGDQMDFPTNLNDNGGGPVPNPVGDTTPEFNATQGGGIFLNAYARFFDASNNILTSNGGTYGGAVRVGTPNVGDNQNDSLRILNNRILANGGTNLAGAIAIFNGATSYEIAQNDVCGNFSAEYGGGISHFGRSSNARIHDNHIYFNGAYDEGAGIMIAGELPANPASQLSEGSGAVDVYNNLIQGNLANDDGGGLRFLMAGNDPINVYNNFIVNNISTHEGGGIALDDATNVRIFNNTVMKNITTATAMTSTGAPMPAGLSDTATSALLQATLPLSHKTFSDPLLFNNVFWDNRAGAYDFLHGTVGGIGLAGDPAPINPWDMGVADGTGLLSPTYSILQTFVGTNDNPPNFALNHNKQADPMVVAPYDVSVSVLPWRGDPNFVGAVTVVIDAPVTQLGDYHLTGTGSPATNSGVSSKSGVSAPSTDIDANARPSSGGFEIGADEIPPGSAPATFPQTSVLDSFTRANSTGLGSNWKAQSTTKWQIVSNQAAARQSGGSTVWTTSFGASQEAYMTFGAGLPVTSGSEAGLLLKVTGLSTSLQFTSNTRYISVRYLPTAGQVAVKTVAPGQGSIVRATFAATFVSGNTIGVRVENGLVKVFKNGVQIGSTVNVAAGATPWPAAYVTGGGRIGMRVIGGAAIDTRVDNFGGGTLP